jgi:hypothetical protein
VLELSFNEEFDDMTDLLMAATSMVNKEFLLPPRRGS